MGPVVVKFCFRAVLFFPDPILNTELRWAFEFLLVKKLTSFGSSFNRIPCMYLISEVAAVAKDRLSLR